MDKLPTAQYLNIGQEYEAAVDEKNVSKSLRNYVIALEKDLDLFGGLEVTNVKETALKVEEIGHPLYRMCKQGMSVLLQVDRKSSENIGRSTAHHAH